MDRAALTYFCISRYLKLSLSFLLVYLLTLLTSFLRETSLWDIYFASGRAKGIASILYDMLGLAYSFGTPTLNGTWWYMSLAIFYVFAIPPLIMVYKRIGILLVIIALLFQNFWAPDTAFFIYFSCVILGIFCAEEKIIERLSSFQLPYASPKYGPLWALLKLLAWSLVFACLLRYRILFDPRYWLDAFIAVVVCLICMQLHAVAPGLGKLMSFIGQHSMNIFLVHTLIFLYYFRDFIYSFQYWGLSLLMLLITSLMVSILLEWLKKVLNLNQIAAKLSQRLCSFLY